jgi:GLPGLI family protein
MRILIIVLFITLAIPSFAQIRFDYPITEIEPVDLMITYSLDFKEDTLNLYYTRHEKMVLFIGENTSKFLSWNMYKIDTILRGISNFEELQALYLNERPNPKLFYMIFKNYPPGAITYIEHIPSNTFRYKEELDIFSWELHPETDTISGHFVQKATTKYGGRKWVAWFCSDIPYSDGPYKFSGLPGLILSVYDTREHYVFKMQIIEKPAEELMIDLTEKDFVEVSKQEFFKAKDSFYGNIISRAKEAGLSSESQQTAARNVSEKNNPIELRCE